MTGVSRDSVPSGPAPMKRPEVQPPSEASGSTIAIVGTLHSSEDFTFGGMLTGSVKCDGKVVVLETGRLKANISAESLTLRGSVVGDIDVLGKIEINKDAKLVGNVKCTRITIDDGAYFKGSVDITARRKRFGLALVDSAEATRLDNAAEDEIARGVYQDLDEDALFGTSVPRVPTLAAAEQLKSNAGIR